MFSKRNMFIGTLIILVVLFLATGLVYGKEVILRIPHYKAGENVGAKFFLPQVERFNEAYDGKYEIVIEEIPQDQYFNKIKLLQQQNQLPPLIEGADREFMEKVIIKNDLFYDLKPWIDSNPELKKLLVKDAVEFNTRDGKIVSLPYAVIRPIGLYYNKEMFEKAGITKQISAMSYDEFDQALAKLKEAGYNPLALMTGENAWTTMLFTTTILASESGGTELLNNSEIVYDYTGEPWVNTFARIQNYFQKFTTGNALGAAYAEAANNFLNERAAIIGNGPWMVGDFSDTSKTSKDFEQKVGADIYPNGAAIAVSRDFHWWIPKGLDEDVREGALAFLKFMYKPEELEAFMVAEGGVAPNLETSADFDSKLDPILLELNNAISDNLKITVPTVDRIWPPQIGQDEFGKYLPKLADDSLTPAEFAEALSRQAKKFK